MDDKMQQASVDLVHRRAFTLWEREGRRHGADQRHWYDAEAELKRGPFLGLFDPWEIDALLESRSPGRAHPVAHLAAERREFHGLDHWPRANFITSPRPVGQVLVTTEMAAKVVRAHAPQWLIALKARLASNDFENAAGALGELRAYAALIEAFSPNAVIPQVTRGTPSPEFEVDAGDGPVVIEVHSKQLDKSERDALDAHATALQERVSEARRFGQGGVISSITTIAPMGRPNPAKAGDTVQANVISRIAAIKEKEHQLVQREMPFVLWLDLQEFGTWVFEENDDQAWPLSRRSRNQ